MLRFFSSCFSRKRDLTSYRLRIQGMLEGPSTHPIQRQGRMCSRSLLAETGDMLQKMVKGGQAAAEHVWPHRHHP
jgi:hypothetical protein